MNPLGLGAGELLLWGLVAHLVADWLLQSDWMAANKAKRRSPRTIVRNGYGPPWFRYRSLIVSEDPEDTRWWDRHPAAYAHAGVHALAFAPLLGWASLPLAVAHLIIDTRTPVAWWARLVRQTPPKVPVTTIVHPTLELRGGSDDRATVLTSDIRGMAPVVDVGMLVRMAVDQAWHVVSIAAAALLVAS